MEVVKLLYQTKHQQALIQCGKIALGRIWGPQTWSSLGSSWGSLGITGPMSLTLGTNGLGYSMAKSTLNMLMTPRLNASLLPMSILCFLLHVLEFVTDT